MVGEVLEDNCAEYVERDPTGRYIRYNEVLGIGAFKTVYKAFDEIDGIEVAWNQIEIKEVVQSQEQLVKLYSEVRLLKLLKHGSIIKLYHSWVDEKRKTVNMITELFTSGSLRQYRKKHKNVDIKAIKNWARQILLGLQYLHSHVPPIIHRDVKCDNIFVNGNNGGVKIGDLGLATIMRQPTAHSVIGTPEFMAPEMYDEEYNELVDVYSFGMSMLEMVTCEYPYCECKNPAQIFRKVTSGIKPASLDKVKDFEVKQFIEKCLRPSSSRLSASELLDDPFLIPENSKSKQPPESLNLPLAMQKSIVHPKLEALPMDIDYNSKMSPTNTYVGRANDTSSTIELQKMSDQQLFSLLGKRKDDTKIKIDLSISGGGVAKKFSFKFYLHSDTALSVANEMVEELHLSIKDVAVVASLIDELLARLQSAAISAGAKNKSSSTISIDGLHLWDSEFSDYSESTNLIATDAHQESSISERFQFSADPQGSFKATHCESLVEDMNLTGNDSLLPMSKDEGEDMELKLELEAIAVHFNECYNDLLRRKQEATESAKLKWLERKKTTFVNRIPFSEAVQS